jgi:hypothetical protein
VLKLNCSEKSELQVLKSKCSEESRLQMRSQVLKSDCSEEQWTTTEITSVEVEL